MRDLNKQCYEENIENIKIILRRYNYNDDIQKKISVNNENRIFVKIYLKTLMVNNINTKNRMIFSMFNKDKVKMFEFLISK